MIRRVFEDSRDSLGTTKIAASSDIDNTLRIGSAEADNTEMAAGSSGSLCSIFLFVGLFIFVSADQKIIIAESGQNVTLPCSAPNNNEPIIFVEWSRADLKPHYVLLYQDGQFDPEKQHPFFVNRVDLQDKWMMDGNVSLILRNVMSNDTGVYECHVFMKGTNHWNRPDLKRDPISIVSLAVVPPCPPGGDSIGQQLLKAVPLSDFLALIVIIFVYVHARYF